MLVRVLVLCPILKYVVEAAGVKCMLIVFQLIIAV